MPVTLGRAVVIAESIKVFHSNLRFPTKVMECAKDYP